jgi:hypothetical protein
MGLFRRRETPADPTASPGPAEPAVAPADPGPPAWATLPPLRPTISAPASTFMIGAAVKEDLVALDSPRLSHGMGHLVSSDGPPGVISGLARTVQRQPSTSAGGPLDLPMAPTSAAEAEPAPARPIFVPSLVPSSNGNGDRSSEGWSPPASPISAAVAAPPPTRDLPLAPTIQRQADPAASPTEAADVPSPTAAEPEASPVPEDQAPASPAEPAPEPEPSAAPPVAGPPDSTPRATPAVPRASSEPSDTTPTVPRASTEPSGGTPTVQRASPSPTATSPPAAPTVPRASAEATSSTEPSGRPAATDLPSLTLPTAPRASVQRQATQLPDLTLPTARRSPGASAEHSAADAAVQRRVDEAVPAPPRPRPGAIGPPLETRPLHAPMALQRSADGPAASVPAGAVPVSEPAVPPMSELAIRQRPHPSVQRSAEQGDGVLRPAGAPVPGAGPALPVTPAPGGRTASPPPAPELAPEPEPSEAEPSEAAPGPGDAAPADTAAPGFPLPLAPAVGRGEAPDVPVVGQSGTVGFVPLVAQRSLAGPAGAPAAPRVAPEAGPVALPSWSVATAGPVVQRWPDLSSVRNAGRGLTERASDAAGGLLTRGRDAAGNALSNVPSLPEAADLPSLGSLPGMSSVPDMLSVPRIPGVPPRPSLSSVPEMLQAPGRPQLPQLPSMPLPQLPQLPSMPLPQLRSMPRAPSLLSSAPTVPSVPGMPSPSIPGLLGAAGGGGGGGDDVPMTEITFPAPSDGGGGGGGATTPAPEPSAPAPAPAAAPSGGAGAAGTGDLDELAHKLYDRIRWRMRSELRLDMERAGLGAGTSR